MAKPKYIIGSEVYMVGTDRDPKNPIKVMKFRIEGINGDGTYDLGNDNMRMVPEPYLHKRTSQALEFFIKGTSLQIAHLNQLVVIAQGMLEKVRPSGNKEEGSLVEKPN